MIEREYRVWHESSDLIWSGDSLYEAKEWLAETVEDHIAHQECEGCGVLTPKRYHGFSIQVCEDGLDITGHPDAWHVH